MTQTSSPLKPPPTLPREGDVCSKGFPEPPPTRDWHATHGHRDRHPRGLCPVEIAPKREGDQHQPNHRCMASTGKRQTRAPLGRAERVCGTLQASLGGRAFASPAASPADRAKPPPSPTSADDSTCSQPAAATSWTHYIAQAPQQRDRMLGQVPAPPARAALSRVSPPNSPPPAPARLGARRPRHIPSKRLTRQPETPVPPHQSRSRPQRLLRNHPKARPPAAPPTPGLARLVPTPVTPGRATRPASPHSHFSCRRDHPIPGSAESTNPSPRRPPGFASSGTRRRPHSLPLELGGQLGTGNAAPAQR